MTEHNKYLDDDDDSSIGSNGIDIHEIVRTHNLAEVKIAIAKDRPRLIAAKDAEGRIPLHHSVMLDRHKVSLFLIAKQSDINARDDEERTPLHYAAMNGLTEMCRFLLDFNANIKLRDTNCWTVLHHAVNNNHFDTATLLIKRGADLNPEDHKYGRTPLHLASELGLHRMAEMLIVRGANFAASGDAFFSKTPLHLAVLNNHLETVKVLCYRGADTNILSGLLDKSPLHFACEKGYAEIVSELIKYNAAVNDCGITINGSSPLHLAVEHGHFNVIQVLLEEGKADIEVQGRFSTVGTPLHHAVRHNQLMIVRFLLDYHANINAVDPNKHTPLHIACKYEKYEIAAMLIEEFADYKAKSLSGKRAVELCPDRLHQEALTIACQNAEVVKQNIAKEKRFQEMVEEERIKKIQREEAERMAKEEKERREREERTSKFVKKLSKVVNFSGEYAALIEVAKEFPDQNINEKVEDFPGSTPNATPNKSSETALVPIGSSNALVTKDHYSNGSSRSGPSTGGTALTRAAYFGHAQVVAALLQWPGINVNATEDNGNTALHNAAINGNQEVIEDLLSHPQMNFGLMNHEGKAAANYAPTNGLRELLRNPQMVKRRRRFQDAVMFDIFHRREEAIVSQSLAIKDIRQESNLLAASEEMMHVTKLLESAKSSIEAADIVTATASSISSLVPTLPLIGSTGNCNTSASSSTKVASSSAIVSLPPIPGASASSPSKLGSFANSLVLANANPLPASTSSLPFSTHKINTSASSTGPGSTAAALESINHLLVKHGPVPEKFGGSRGDFFNLLYYQPQQLYTKVNSRGGMFMDVFTMQKSYIPTAFDTTDEWCEVKDFLWLLGFPYRIKGPPPIQTYYEQTSTAAAPATTEEHQEGQNGITGTSIQGSDDVPVEGSGEDIIAAPVHEQEQTYDYSQAEYKVEKKSIVYNMSIAMDHLQRVFITPTHLIATFEWGGRTMEEKSNIDEENVKQEDLPEGMHLPIFASSIGTGNKQTSSTSMTSPTRLSHIHASSLPKNISHLDFLRLQLFSDYCLKFLKEFLRLYDTYSVDYYDYLTRQEKIEYYHTHIAYLRDHCYIDYPTSELLEKLLPFCDVLRHSYDVPQFTNLMENVKNVVEKKKKERKRRRSIKRMASFNANASTTSMSTAGGVESETDGEDDDDDLMGDDEGLMRFNDPLRTLWSELVLNPPRAMRSAVDAVYELAFSTMKQLENAYPLDTVRAHLWAHHGRLLLQQKVEEEIARTKKLHQQQLISDHAKKEEAHAQALIDAKNAKQQSAKHYSFDDLAATLNKLKAAEKAGVVVDPTSNQIEDIDPKIPEVPEVPIVEITVTPLQVWLQELELMEYEEYFSNLGFRLLEDFEELNDQDCYRYFPFLKVGDSRRLAKHCEGVDEIMIKKYKKKAKQINKKHKGITSISSKKDDSENTVVSTA